MPKQSEPYRIGISGSYGGLNLGDEAILEGIIAPLRAALPAEITVFSRDPEDTLRRHRVERAIAVRQMSRNEVVPEIQRLDLLILGGGGILFDGDAGIYLREVMLAHENNVPVMVYAVGAGPLSDPKVQQQVCEALEPAVAVTVRDRGAQKLLEEVGVQREIVVTADPALLLKPSPLPPGALEREGLTGKRHLIGMSVREPGQAAPDLQPDSYHELLANAADFMADRFEADIVMVPMERQVLDVQHCHAVIARMLRASRARVLKDKYTSGEMLSLVGHFDLVVGMRLHFMIFAALAGVPFVALPYSSKVHGFIEEFQLEMPPLELVNAGRLIAHLDHYWDRKRWLINQVNRVLPQLRQRARRNNEILVNLLTGAGGESPEGENACLR